MAEHGKEFEVLHSIIQVMVDTYNTEMRNDIIREKAIRISAEVRQDKKKLAAIADQLKVILDSIHRDTATIEGEMRTTTDQKTQTWGAVTLKTLDATDAYLTEYLHACEQAIAADADADLSDLFEVCDNMRDAFEVQYEAFVQVTGIK